MRRRGGPADQDRAIRRVGIGLGRDRDRRCKGTDGQAVQANGPKPQVIGPVIR
jgi:hypothetical protein